MVVVLVEAVRMVMVGAVVEVKKVKEEVGVRASTLVRSMPSLSCDSRWRMMLRWSSRTPRSSSSLSSVSVTSSDGLMSSSPVCCSPSQRKKKIF